MGWMINMFGLFVKGIPCAVVICIGRINWFVLNRVARRMGIGRVGRRKGRIGLRLGLVGIRIRLVGRWRMGWVGWRIG